MTQPIRLLALAGLLAVAAWVFGASWNDFRADRRSEATRHAIAAWVGGERRGPDAAAFADAKATLEAAIAIQPRNPTLHASLGDLGVIAFEQPWATPADRTAMLNMAVSAYRQVLTIRPRDVRMWTALAMAMTLQGQRGAAVNEAWKNAHRFGPNEGYVLRQKFLVVVQTWDGASPEMQKWATDLYENGTKAERAAINRVAKGAGLEFSSDQPPRP